MQILTLEISQSGATITLTISVIANQSHSGISSMTSLKLLLKLTANFCAILDSHELYRKQQSNFFINGPWNQTVLSSTTLCDLGQVT